MTRWAVGCGRDVDVDDSSLDVIDSDEDGLVFDGRVVGKKIIFLYWQVRGVLPNQESKTSSLVRPRSVTADNCISWERNRVRAEGELSLLDAGHPDVVGGEEMLKFVPRVANPVAVEL